VVTIHYSLPSASAGAKLCIFNVNGEVVQNFGLRQGNNVVSWGIAGKNVAAGIVWWLHAAWEFEQKIQISIVK